MGRDGVILYCMECLELLQASHNMKEDIGDLLKTAERSWRTV
jgi:hypothetical protein